ncbi:MAG: type 1 glutamine amidotransferase family protein [bacterium]
MDKKIIYIYVLDTLADWEPGFALAELRTGRFFKKDASTFDVKTVALSKDPITTMGGLRVLPDITVGDVALENAGLLLLPGGEVWMDASHAPILQIANQFLGACVPVAAICGATVALAGTGALDNRDHTSNDLGFLKSVCPSYLGEKRYKNEPAVIGGDLITAGGAAPIEFAYCIMKKLDVLAPEALEAWLNLYKTHEAKYFMQLIQASGWTPS